MLIYVVRPNDTLWGIARRYGSTVEYLAYINGIADPSRLVPGMTVIIPLQYPAPPTEAEVNAYVYPNVGSAALDAALPAVSYLSPFSYSFDTVSFRTMAFCRSASACFCSRFPRSLWSAPATTLSCISGSRRMVS